MVCGDGFNRFDGEVLHLTQATAVPFSVVNPTRLTVEVAAEVAGQLVLLHAQADQATINVRLGEGAQLDVVELFTAEAFVELGIVQASHSRCTVTLAELASANLTCKIALNGAHAENDVNGVFLVSHAEHAVVDVQTTHRATDCRSKSLIKGVAAGSATGEFRGLVYVAPDAQRTDAQQQSRNIELSDTAHITTRPQLEIYADDVKCSHGATVGQMDTEAILYMRQRGLSEAQARALQIEGFVGDVVQHCPIESLREELMRLVTVKLENV